MARRTDITCELCETILSSPTPDGWRRYIECDKCHVDNEPLSGVYVSEEIVLPDPPLNAETWELLAGKAIDERKTR